MDSKTWGGKRPGAGRPRTTLKVTATAARQLAELHERARQLAEKYNQPFDDDLDITLSAIIADHYEAKTKPAQETRIFDYKQSRPAEQDI